MSKIAQSFVAAATLRSALIARSQLISGRARRDEDPERSLSTYMSTGAEEQHRYRTYEMASRKSSYMTTRCTSNGVFILACILWLVTRADGRPSHQSMAIIGDSISTGGGSHPEIAFDFKKIWRILLGEVDVHSRQRVPDQVHRFVPISSLDQRPQILWPSSREYRGAGNWLTWNLLRALSGQYLNSEELSWGYLLGRKLGVAGHGIYIAANNGARVRDIPDQIDRILKATDGVVPPVVMVFFTGNDLCGPSWSAVTSSSDFGSQLQRGLTYLTRYGKPHPGGSNVLVLSYLGVTQILTKPSILQKPLTAFGEETTCKELRFRSYRPKDLQKALSGAPPASIYFSNILPPNPAISCPTVNGLHAFAYDEVGPFTGFGKKDRSQIIQGQVNKTVDKYVAELSTKIRSYQSTSAQVVRNLESQRINGFRFFYVPQTAEIELIADDIGQDCFHLSRLGQLKVAKAVYSGLPKELGFRR